LSIVRTTKQALVLFGIGLVAASVRGQTGASGRVVVQPPRAVVSVPASSAVFPDVVEPGTNPVRRPMRNVSDTHPYGDDPSGSAPFDARLEAAIDASNPYAFNGGGAALPERALPRVAVLRQLDSENPYLSAVEHAPIDSENPYITGTR
jgi:hypothetical protein